MNREILAGAIQNREFFERVEPHVRFVNQVDSGLFDVIRDYYRTDPQAAHVDLVYLQHILRLGNKTEQAKDRFVAYASELSALVVPSLANVQKFVVSVREQELRQQLAEQLLAPNYERAVANKLLCALQDLGAADVGSEVLHDIDIEQLAESYTQEGILFGCKSMRARLGYGARGGHHILVFARPNLGKTQFAIDCAADVAGQGLVVAYAQNEEPMKTTVMRMVCRLARVSLTYFARNPTRVNELARERGYGNVFFLDLSPGHIGQLNSHVRRIKPALCVVDQVRNMVADAENNTQRLEGIARGVRNVGRANNCIMLSVTQAGDSAENKQYLSMGDVDGSNTGIQGAVDMQMGIGANADDKANGMRWVSITKDKIGGDSTPFSYTVDSNTGVVQG